MEIIKPKGGLHINFHADHYFLMVENNIPVGNLRQLTACLQYLCNVDKLSGHGLVYDRNIIDHDVDSSLLPEQDMAQPAMNG